jgi:tetratricopeptide (TPR) repeat protein
VYALVALKRFDDALPVQRQVVALDPRSAEQHARLGRLYLEERNFAAAEGALRAALQLNPGQTEALRDLVAASYLGEKFEQALATQDLLAKREEPTAGFWFIRATCYDKLRRKAEALDAYRMFLAMDHDRNPDQGIQARGRIRALENELKRK